MKTSHPKSILKELFGIDLRSLALFRIAIALILLYDLAIRATDLTLFYTDSGAVPRAFLWNKMPNQFTISLHMISGTALAQKLLFLLQGACAVGLLVGYRTRAIVFLCWLLTISLQDRNPLVGMGGADVYLRILLFFSLFLPLGKYFSLDANRGPQEEKSSFNYLSWGTCAILLQIAMVYLMTSALKWEADIWMDGTAVYSVLSNEVFAKPLGEFILQFPTVMKYLTYGVLCSELLAPGLLFFPIVTGPIRTFTVFGLILMHLGFILCLHIHLFQLVSVAALFLFLPSWFWDKLRTRSAHSLRSA